MKARMISKTTAALVASSMIALSANAVSYADGDVEPRVTVTYNNVIENYSVEFSEESTTTTKPIYYSTDPTKATIIIKDRPAPELINNIRVEGVSDSPHYQNISFDNATTPNSDGSYTIGDHGTIEFPPGSGGTINVGGVKDNPTIPQNTVNFHLDSEEYSITVGHQFEVEGLLSSASGGTNRVSDPIIFFSANPNILTIDSYGTITGISPGITKITAIYQGQIVEASVWVFRPYVRKS